MPVFFSYLDDFSSCSTSPPDHGVSLTYTGHPPSFDPLCRTKRVGGQGKKCEGSLATESVSHLQSFCAEMCCGVASSPMWITGLLAYCSFATFGRFDCLQSLRWDQIDLSDEDQMVVSFESRKNDQFREGSQVVVPSRDDALDLVSLMISWKQRSPANKGDDFVFLNFPFNANSRNLDSPVHTR